MLDDSYPHLYVDFGVRFFFIRNGPRKAEPPAVYFFFEAMLYGLMITPGFFL